MDFLTQTWSWYVSGFLIVLVMFLLIYFGKTFGMSSNLRSLCSIAGANKYADFFKFDYKSQNWNLVVLLGAMIGGYVAVHFLSSPNNVALNAKTIDALAKFGFDAPHGKIAPDIMFGNNIFFDLKMILILLFGGIMIGFGSRYAGGCTSGHAIQGLSNLQWQSLKAVIGFFVGGLLMVHFIFPLIF